MRDAVSTHPESYEAQPINILRVTSASSRAGYVLYSGITTHTIMAPTNTATQSSDVGDDSRESRATQTDNINRAKGSRQQQLSTEKSKVEKESLAPRVKPHCCLAREKEGARQSKGKVTSKDGWKNNSKQKESIYERFQRVSVTKQGSNVSPIKKDSVVHGKDHSPKNKESSTRTRNLVTGTSGRKSGLDKKSDFTEKILLTKTAEIKTEEPKDFTEKECPPYTKQALKLEDHHDSRSETFNKNVFSPTKELEGDMAPHGSEDLQARLKLHNIETKTCPNHQTCNETSAKTNGLPLISWLEGSSSNRTEIPVSLYSSLFEQCTRPPPQNVSHTPRILVSPKHTCPEGLTAQDVILGICINPGTTIPGLSREHRKGQEEHLDGDLQPNSQNNLNVRRVKSAVLASQVKTTDNSRVRKRPVTVQHGMLRRPTTSPSTSAVNLELNIISLGPSKSHQHDHCKHTQDSEGKDHSSAKSWTSPLDTMEAIKRSYHRIQSAPPLSTGRECHRQRGGTSRTDGERCDDVKKFSSPYWRAKSAYHRRVLYARDSETQGFNTEECGNSQERTEEGSLPQGTLLRPLLYTSEGGLLRHGAGCPYKCRNCFRACLVSDDFAQKAKQKLGRGNNEMCESSLEHQASPSKPYNENVYTKTAKRRGNTIAIVKRELARSQPLFQRVYGVKGHPQTIRPWPSYDWMDIKQKKSDHDTEVAYCADDTGHQ